MKSPYFKFSNYLKEKYGGKIWKIPVDAGFSCPNKDPLTGEGGCIFCRNDSFSHMSSIQDININKQIEKLIHSGSAFYGVNKYIVYFQSSTNTYAPINILRKFYMDAVSHEGIVGIAIATRPDCLSDDVLELFKELAKKVDVWIELGMQSSHDNTLTFINRGHSFADYLAAVKRLLLLPVRICTHIMIGLPGEDKQHIIQTANEIAKTNTHDVKIHPLLFLKDTGLEKLYFENKVKVLEESQYIESVCDFLERIPPGMVVQRLTAEAPKEMVIAPNWVYNKLRILQHIDKEFKRRNTIQGYYYEAPV